MAIAFDAASKQTQVSASTVTISHTCTGSNRLLLVGFITNNVTDLVTGVTYSGTSMTQLTTQATASAGFISYVFGLLAPATGANNIVISFSVASLCYATNASYTGVDQSALPTGAAIASNNSTGTTWSQAVTTTANNSWIFVHGRNPPTQTVDSGGHIRATNDPDDGMCGDNGPYATAGSNTISGTNGGPSANQTTIAVGFAPAGASNSNFLMFMPN